VPASADESVPAIALPEMGRFSHEACAVDPGTWIVYETEDAGNTSGFYRFIPHTRGVLADGGRLQMLAIDGVPNYATHTGQTVGVALPVTWVDIADPDPPLSATPSTDVSRQGAALGAASFARLEGCWWGNHAIYFAATSGGDAGLGQVWEFRPRGDGGTLTLIFESGGPTQLDSPDNVAVSPGGAIMLCEDGDDDQYLRGLTINGEIFDFALNLETEHEWAGATFAVADPRWNDSRMRGGNPALGSLEDRTTLFVNRQGATRGTNPPAPGQEGITFAIWGPWAQGAF
jgi:secreted PhoX family phosphatase